MSETKTENNTPKRKPNWMGAVLAIAIVLIMFAVGLLPSPAQSAATGVCICGK